MTLSIGDNGGNPTQIATGAARNAGFASILVQNPADSGLDMHFHQGGPGEAVTGTQAGVPVLVPGESILLSTTRDVWLDGKDHALMEILYTFLP